MVCHFFFFFFKQKTAYEMRISDWSSDVCSSDLVEVLAFTACQKGCPISFLGPPEGLARFPAGVLEIEADVAQQVVRQPLQAVAVAQAALPGLQRPGGRQQQPDEAAAEGVARLVEHTSEIQSLMRISLPCF